MEQVLLSSDDRIVVYVSPTKALVNQVWECRSRTRESVCMSGTDVGVREMERETEREKAGEERDERSKGKNELLRKSADLSVDIREHTVAILGKDLPDLGESERGVGEISIGGAAGGGACLAPPLEIETQQVEVGL